MRIVVFISAFVLLTSICWAAATTSLSLDGVSQYGTVPSTATLGVTNALTLEMWVKPTTAAPLAKQYLIDSRSSNPTDGFVLYLDTNGDTVFSYTYSCVAPVSWHANQWMHIAVISGSGGSNVFINGVLSCSVAAESTLSTAASKIFVGATYKAMSDPVNTLFFSGSLSEIRIWNVQRTQADIADSVSSRLFNPSGQVGLSAYYSLASGSPIRAVDASGNGRNMLLYGFPGAARPFLSAGPDLNMVQSPCAISCTMPATLDSCACRCVQPAGYGLLFDGVGDQISANLGSVSQSFTISLYYLAPAGSSQQYVFDARANGASWFLRVNTDNSLSFSSSCSVAAGAFTPGQWAHLFIVSTPSDVRVYVNNVAQPACSAVAAGTNTLSDFKFGSSLTGANLLTGQIDKFYFWSSSLSGVSNTRFAFLNRISQLSAPVFRAASDISSCTADRLDSLSSMTVQGVKLTLSTAPVPVSAVTSIAPMCLHLAGGVPVTVHGVNLGDSDVTGVTLAGSTVSPTSQSPSAVVLTAPSAAAVGVYDLDVLSTSFGTISAAQSFVYATGNGGNIVSVVPVQGPNAGGNVVTIRGDLIGSGSDITSVTVCGIDATILSQTRTTVTVITGGPYQGVGSVVVASTCVGVTTQTIAYRYNVPGFLQVVDPAAGDPDGGDFITISGRNLGSGTDITKVTLAGVPVYRILQQGTGQVVVISDAVPELVVGDVVVWSTAYGATIGVAAFQYGIDPSCPKRGGKLLSVAPIKGRSTGGNLVTLSGQQLGYDGDITQVTIAGRTAAIISQTNDSVIVNAASSPAGWGHVIVRSRCAGTSVRYNSYYYNPTPNIVEIKPNAGSVAGGDTVTVTGYNLGDGADITSVTLFGVPVQSIVSQRGCQVVVIAGPAVGAGNNGVVLTESASFGFGKKTNAFSYYANVDPSCPGIGSTVNGFGGQISSVVPTNGPYQGLNIVTISGTNLGRDAADVTMVKLRSTVVTTYTWVSSTRILAVAPARVSPGLGDVEVYSRCFGYIHKMDICIDNSGYNYNNPPSIRYVLPRVGVPEGNYRVSIVGNNLNQGDTTFASLVGVPVQSIVSQSSSMVVVNAGEYVAANPITIVGNVVTESTRQGRAEAVNLFTYKTYDPNCPEFGLQITSVSPSSGSGHGSATVTISVSPPQAAADVTSVSLRGIAATILDKTSTPGKVIVRTGGVSLGRGDVVVDTHCWGLDIAFNSYTYVNDFKVTYLSPSAGLATGGYKVTIVGHDLSNGIDVTAVTLAGVPATIVSQSDTQIVVIAGASSNGDVVGNVVTYSKTYGAEYLPSGWRYFTFVDLRCPGLGGEFSADSNFFSGPGAGGNRITIRGTDLHDTTDSDDVVQVSTFNIGATLVSTSGLPIVVDVNGVGSGTGDLVVRSMCFGASVLSDGYRYNLPPKIEYVTPSAGPVVGGVSVTVSGYNLGDGADVYTGSLVGTSVASIDSQSAFSVVMTASAYSGGDAQGAADIFSWTYGQGHLNNGFKYFSTFNPLCPGFGGSITSVVPSTGPRAGGNRITIIGTAMNTGNAADVVSVRLKREDATVISVSATEIVVEVPNGPSGAGEVQVLSTCFGASLKAKGYRFNIEPVITGVKPSAASMDGGDTVTILGSNLAASDVTSVTLAGVPATVISASAKQIVVVTGEATTQGSGDVVTNSVSFGQGVLADGFSYFSSPNLVCPQSGGSAMFVSPSAGRLAGGTHVTITGTGIGAGSDITSVSFNGVTAVILSQAADSVVVAVPSGVVAGAVDVSVRSTCYGLSLDTDGFSYNPSPLISAVTPSRSVRTGGATITIMGINLASAPADLQGVSLNGIAASVVNIVAPTNGGSSWSVIAISGAADYNDVGNVVTQSTSYGSAVLPNGFEYVDVVDSSCAGSGAFISTVTPTMSLATSRTRVVITGTLGNYDISTVSFAGIPASIESQSPTEVVAWAQPVASSQAGHGDVVIVSSCLGGAIWGPGSVPIEAGYTYCPAVGATVTVGTTIATGPMRGGNRVTINGAYFADGTNGDTSATVTFGANAATIVSASATQLVVIAPAAGAIGAVTVNIGGWCYGSTTYQYTYVVNPLVATLSRITGPIHGGLLVTITGVSLGFNNDITSVTMAGVASTIISQSSTQVVVQSPAGAAGTHGSIVTSSTTWGSATLQHSWTFTRGTINSVVPSVAFGSGGQDVTITGVDLHNNDVTAVTLAGLSATILSWTSSTVTVRTASFASATTGNVEVYSTMWDVAVASSAFSYVQPTITAITPSVGPVSGNFEVTIEGQYLGAGDITSVTLGVAATIVSQSSQEVVVRTGAVSHSTPFGVDVVTSSTITGTATAFLGFVYEQPTIFSIDPPVTQSSGGATVTVSGQYLLEVTSLTLNGVAATVVSSDGFSLVATTGISSSDGTGDVVFTSTVWGVATLPSAFTYTSATIQSVTPSSGPAFGGDYVTIYGTSMTYNGDVESVTVAGVAATVVSAAATEIVVLTGQASGEVTGDIVVVSLSAGTSSLAAAYTYQVSTITAVHPNAASRFFGNVVTVTGTNLYGVQSVSFCGENGIVVSSSSTELIVQTSPGFTVGTGDVISDSPSWGTATFSNGFTYVAPVITSVVPNSGPTAGGQTVTVEGTDLCYNNDCYQVRFAGINAASIVSQSASQLVVVSGGGAAATLGDVVVASTNYVVTQLAGGYRYIVPTVTSVSPPSGNKVGGSTVTITGANFNDIIAVTMAGVGVASIQSFTSTQVVVVTGATTVTTLSLQPVVVTSSSWGVAQSSNAFRYVTPVINAPVPASKGNMFTTGNDVFTITGSELGLGGSDITAVFLAGIPATIQGSPSSFSITVRSGATSSGITGGSIVVQSIAHGTTTLNGVINYVSAQPELISDVLLANGVDVVLFGRTSVSTMLPFKVTWAPGALSSAYTMGAVVSASSGGRVKFPLTPVSATTITLVPQTLTSLNLQFSALQYTAPSTAGLDTISITLTSANPVVSRTYTVTYTVTNAASQFIIPATVQQLGTSQLGNSFPTTSFPGNYVSQIMTTGSTDPRFSFSCTLDSQYFVQQPVGTASGVWTTGVPRTSTAQVNFQITASAPATTFFCQPLMLFTFSGVEYIAATGNRAQFNIPSGNGHASAIEEGSEEFVDGSLTAVSPVTYATPIAAIVVAAVAVLVIVCFIVPRYRAYIRRKQTAPMASVFSTPGKVEIEDTPITNDSIDSPTRSSTSLLHRTESDASTASQVSSPFTPPVLPALRQINFDKLQTVLSGKSEDDALMTPPDQATDSTLDVSGTVDNFMFDPFSAPRRASRMIKLQPMQPAGTVRQEVEPEMIEPPTAPIRRTESIVPRRPSVAAGVALPSLSHRPSLLAKGSFRTSVVELPSSMSSPPSVLPAQLPSLPSLRRASLAPLPEVPIIDAASDYRRPTNAVEVKTSPRGLPSPRGITASRVSLTSLTSLNVVAATFNKPAAGEPNLEDEMF